MTNEELELKRKCFEQYKQGAFPITPLNGKAPVLEDWPSTKFDPNIDFNSYTQRNFGVVLSPMDIVIDVDPRNFDPGDEPLRRLVKDFGFTADDLDTYVVKTGSGGVHLYYRKTTEINTRGKLKGYKGIDFKAAGGQVVGAGCIHPDTGAQYTPYRGSPLLIKKLPDALLRRLDVGARVDNTSHPGGDGVYTDSPDSVNRFVHYLKFAAPVAIEGDSGNSTTYKVACYARDLGLSNENTYELMSKYWNPLCQPEWSESELQTLINNAYAYAIHPAGCKDAAKDFEVVDKDDGLGLGVNAEQLIAERRAEISTWQARASWDLGKKGEISKNLHNTVIFLDHPGYKIAESIRLNELSSTIEIWDALPWRHVSRGHMTPWSDEDNIQLKYLLTDRFKYEVSVNLIYEAVVVTARKRAYHPVRDWLKELKWDGVPRLNTWLQQVCGVKDSVYTQAVGRKTIVAAVARVMHPGIKWDYTTVIEGAQGIGKSTLVSMLGGEFYADIKIDPHSKDTVQAMQGRWIIEISEMECTRRADVEALKSFLSRRVDRVRLPYERSTRDLKRQSIFIGTTNPDAASSYLKDRTGNRRFWPVYANYVKFKLMQQIRDQLFAEAYVVYKSGKEQLFIATTDADAEAQAMQESRVESDPWVDIIGEWVTQMEETQHQKSFTVAEVWTGAFAESPVRLGRLESMRICEAMRDNGWEYTTLERRCRQVRGFKKKIVDA